MSDLIYWWTFWGFSLPVPFVFFSLLFPFFFSFFLFFFFFSFLFFLSFFFFSLLLVPLHLLRDSRYFFQLSLPSNPHNDLLVSSSCMRHPKS